VLVEIVLEGGPQLGFGHAGRCLALWEELGVRCAFRSSEGTVERFLQARGAPVRRAGEAPVVVLDRAVSVEPEEVCELHREGRRVVLVDDLGPAREHADVVLDPPTAAFWPEAAGRRLEGFAHALLRREVREAWLPARTPTRAGGVLLAMGGSDPAGLTPVIAQELSANGLEVTVALGPGYRGLSPTGGSVLASPEEFIPALARAELLIAGYGHSLLEAAHLGVPAIAVVYKPAHLAHARAFCAQGTAQMFDLTAGDIGLGAGELGQAVMRLVGEPLLRAKMSARGARLVDGLGAQRVANVLTELA
jgi:UDP-2,4-diacetamido-2,4,6-trideoxy-beta-L-altropyranose hydrolase